MYKVDFSNQFKKSYKLAQKRGLPIDRLLEVIKVLASGKDLDIKYKDHALTGNYKGFRECHILPDWLLIYKIEKNRCILYLLNTGTHTDLFEWYVYVEACKRLIVYLCFALPVIIEFLPLLVYLFSVINFYYFHSNNIVEYLVHNPIVAHSDSVSALTSQLLITVRSRIVGERIHRTLQCRIVWLRESLHKFRHSLLNQYGILPLRYHFLLYTVRPSRKKYQ